MDNPSASSALVPFNALVPFEEKGFIAKLLQMFHIELAQQQLCHHIELGLQQVDHQRQLAQQLVVHHTTLDVQQANHQLQLAQLKIAHHKKLGLQQTNHQKKLIDQLQQAQQQLCHHIELGLQQTNHQKELTDQLQQAQLNKQKDHLNHLQNRNKKNSECLFYVFCAGITKYINPSLSWIDKKMGKQSNKNNKINETIQRDVQFLQTLSFAATICGGKIDNYYNGFTPQFYYDEDPILWVLRKTMLSVYLPLINAYLLVDCYDDIVDHSKKNDNHALKTIRKLPQPIKTFGRLFIEWGFWRIEKGLFQKFRPL